MNIEVLISTINLKNKEKLVKKMKVKKCTIINQYTNMQELKDIPIGDQRLYSYKEKGLSKSRNRAIEKSLADIIIIADDDLEYVNRYDKIIEEGYKKYKDADIIAFYVENSDKVRKKKKMKEGRIGYLRSMKIQSVQLTMKRKSIEQIKFNECFGIGTDLYMGEENLFLFDCLRKGLRIYYIPIKIANIGKSESIWFTGFDKRYMFVKGCQFYEMSNTFSILLILQYAIRKRKLYKKNFGMIKAIKYMEMGRKAWRKNREREKV